MLLQIERRDQLLAQLREPNSVAATRGLIGNTQMILGDPEAAIATLSEVLEQATVLELDPQLHTMTLWYLALAHLQLAEDENCVLSHSADSCLFPISAAGIHRQPEHSRRAGDYLVEYLKARPDDGQAGWLLNLARQVSGDYPAGVPARVRLPADASRPLRTRRPARSLARGMRRLLGVASNRQHSHALRTIRVALRSQPGLRLPKTPGEISCPRAGSRRIRPVVRFPQSQK